jgi:putative transposase
MHWFLSIADATRTIEASPVDYNEVRPHSSPGRLNPSEYRRQHQQREEALAITPDLPS